MDFDSFGFHGIIRDNIAKQGYTAPTPIQENAIPPILEGHDLMGLAQTGTGKTAAFMLPILQRTMRRSRKNSSRGVRSLIIAPTRELAEQINDSAKKLGRKTGVRCVTVYGGVNIAPQLRALRQGADCVVACPGRLLDVMNRGGIDLSSLEVLVLDEADHMFDMGFLPDLNKIMARLPQERQTLLFSATMPESIKGLANDALRDPVCVAIKNDAPAETVSHTAYPVPQHLKTKLLLALLESKNDGSSLIFTRTKHKARQLAEQLRRAGYKAESLQGNLSQNKRQATMRAFREGACTVLVATDIAARGIDVSKVGHVINYDMPDTPETYTHRIGRTGRAERKGQAYSLTTREDLRMLKAVERLLGKPIDQQRIEGFDYNAPGPKGMRTAAGKENSRFAAKRHDSGNASKPRRPYQGRSREERGGSHALHRSANHSPSPRAASHAAH